MSEAVCTFECSHINEKRIEYDCEIDGKKERHLLCSECYSKFKKFSIIRYSDDKIIKNEATP